MKQTDIARDFFAAGYAQAIRGLAAEEQSAASVLLGLDASYRHGYTIGRRCREALPAEIARWLRR